MNAPTHTPLRPPPADDCRCVCGSLLARLVDGGVELYCRRCKRTLRIPLRPEALSPEPGCSPHAGALETRWLELPSRRS
jgi:hypothetical protein